MSSDPGRIEEAKQLRALEHRLNEFTYNDIKIGSLLAHPLYFIFKDKYEPRKSKQLMQLAKAFATSLANPGKKFSTDKKVFYYRTADRYHLDQIWYSVKNTFKKEDMFVFGGTRETDLSRKNVQKVPFFKLLKLQSWFLANSSKIEKVLKDSPLPAKFIGNLMIDLNFQLISSLFWDDFFKKSTNLQLLAGDFDRGYESSAIFAASKKYNIPSVVIMHGAVSPPYSFTPLIADKVYLWGKMQAYQFIEMEATEEQLVVTGTPIIKPTDQSAEKRSQILSKFNIDPTKKNVVLGITPIRPKYNKILIDIFAELHTELGLIFNFSLKLHPGHKAEDFTWVTEQHGITVLDKKMTQEEYFNVCDVLLAHSTGLANESFYYGIHVGILDVLEISSGNGIELNKYVDVPLLKNYTEIKDFVLACNDEDNVVKDSEVIYAGIGQDADNIIKFELLKYLGS